MTVPHKRAVVYCRVSSERQKIDGESLEYQEEKCLHYAELHNIKVLAVLKEAKSGFIHYLHREKLTLARQMVRDNVADAIIVWDLRRFSRNFVHSAMIFQEIEGYGGEVISVSENIDNSLTGKLIRSILAWSAESEREKIAEYANRHWQKRHELGLPMATSTPPYGWQWGDKEKTYFVPNVEEAAVRRSIFVMFVEMDMSIRQIAHTLTVDGIPAPREARKSGDGTRTVEEEKPKVVPWSTGTIHGYLEDIANIGTLVICKEKKVLLEDGRTSRIQHPEQKVIPNGMPAIVSHELFERAQRKLALNRETKSHRPRDPVNFLLTGHVYCAVCGYRMHALYEKELPVYRCNKRISVLDANPRQCEPHILRIKAELVNQLVWDECCQIFERLDLVQAKIEEKVRQSLDILLEDTTGRDQIIELKATIALAQQRYEQQPDDYVRSLIAQDIAAKKEQLQRYEEECAAASDLSSIRASYLQRALDFVSFVNAMKGDYRNAPFQAKRNAIDVLGVKVYVSPDTARPSNAPVESDQEWLTMSDVHRLTGIPFTTVQEAVARRLLPSEQHIGYQTMVRRNDALAYQQYRQRGDDLSACDDEWFSLHKITAMRVASYVILHRDIDAGILPTEEREVTRTVIHRDALNRFLREMPIKSRPDMEDVRTQVTVRYAPIFTGVQEPKDAQEVVNVVHNAGLATLVARLKPIIVVKG